MCASSTITLMLLISENLTGTPSDGVVVPHLPGPTSSVEMASRLPICRLILPMRRAMSYFSESFRAW